MLLYVLRIYPSLLLIPQAFDCDRHENGLLGNRFTLINASNKEFYLKEASPQNRLLIETCCKLDEKTFCSTYKNGGSTYEQLVKQYFGASNDPDIKLMKRVINDRLNAIVNKFYQHIDQAPLYLYNGRYPSLWKPVSIDTQAQFYSTYQYSRHHENCDQLQYAIQIEKDAFPFSIKDSCLASIQPVRLLKDQMIYTLDQAFEGSALVPFFTHDHIRVPEANTASHLEKFTKRLIPLRCVQSSAFAIIEHESLPIPQLILTNERKAVALDLFAASTTPPNQNEGIVFQLKFQYTDFVFSAGAEQATVRWAKNTFTWVERDKAKEAVYIQHLLELGMDVGRHQAVWDPTEARAWCSLHHNRLQELEIELLDKTWSASDKKYHHEQAQIEITIHESMNWLDLRGQVTFGVFKIPLLMVLKLIRQGHREVALPNGEFAVIPTTWMDTYSLLAQFIYTDSETSETPRIRKHHYHLLYKKNRLQHSGTISDQLVHFMDNQFKNYPQPAEFKTQLLPFQLEGYSWMRNLDELGLGGCLADDMGLGKTVQTLALLQWMKSEKRGTSLLVVPKTLIYNWVAEIRNFCSKMLVIIHADNERSKNTRTFAYADIVITSYAVMRNDIDLLKNFDFNYVILDEAHAIKNPQSGVAKAALQLKAMRYLSLTGTPVENYISDLWAQMNFVNRGILGSLPWFAKQYVPTDPEQMNRLRILVQAFIMRRLKTDVLQELPPKTESVFYCEMIPEQATRYAYLKAKYQADIIDNKTAGTSINNFELLKAISEMRQMACHPALLDSTYEGSSGKFEAITEQLMQVMASGEKVLIFSSYRKHLAQYSHYLDQHQIAYSYMDGTTKDRQAEVANFQNNDTVKVFLISLKTGGTGLNLTKAGCIFMIDPWWNPAVEDQAIARAHRMGQCQPVRVYRFVSRDTVEEKILLLQDQKKDLVASVITSSHQYGNHVDQEMLKSLIN